MAHVPSRNVRATPLPPDERRAAIVAATVPLIRERGLSVSTRQIADAAGVAEGTLFRAFPDKRALVHAAVEAVLDPEPGLRRLAAIDRSAPLEDRLGEAVDLLRTGMESTWRLIVELRTTQGEQGMEKVLSRERWEPVMAALAALFEPDRDRLTVTPEQATRMLHSMLVASLHHFRPGLRNQEPLTTREIVDVVLYGVVGRQPPDPVPPGTRPDGGL